MEKCYNIFETIHQTVCKLFDSYIVVGRMPDMVWIPMILRRSLQDRRRFWSGTVWILRSMLREMTKSRSGRFLTVFPPG